MPIGSCLAPVQARKLSLQEAQTSVRSYQPAFRAMRGCQVLDFTIVVPVLGTKTYPMLIFFSFSKADSVSVYDVLPGFAGEVMWVM